MFNCYHSHLLSGREQESDRAEAPRGGRAARRHRRGAGGEGPTRAAGSGHLSQAELIFLIDP